MSFILCRRSRNNQHSSCADSSGYDCSCCPTNEVDQNHLQSEMAEAQSSIFELSSIHVHSMVL